MALAGPRLDRPSAIGDEGRPRATSLAIASLTVVALFVAAGWVLGSPGLVLGVGTLVGLVAAGIGLQGRTGLVDLFVGHLCLLGGGSLFTIVLIAFSVRTMGLLVAGFTTAMLALALTWANAADEAGFQRALEAGAHSFVAFFGWAIAVGIVVFAGIFLEALMTDPIIARQPIVAATAFALVVAGAGVAVTMAIDTLPIVQLTPRSRRDRIVHRLNAARWVAEQVAKGGIALMVGIIALGAVSSMAAGPTGRPLDGLSLGFLASPVFMGPPVLVAAVASLATILAKTVRTLAAHVENAAATVIPAAAAGLAFLVLVPIVAGGLPRLLLVRPGTVVLLLVLGPLALMVGLALIIAAMSMGVVPDRAGGPAMAAGSLVVATIGTGLLSLPTPLVLATAAAALVVWDVSTFGLGVTAELGHRPETRRLELFHGVLAVGVGVVAVLLLSGVEFLRQTVALDGSVPLAAALAVGGALTAIFVLRR